MSNFCNIFRYSLENVNDVITYATEKWGDHLIDDGAFPAKQKNYTCQASVCNEIFVA